MHSLPHRYAALAVPVDPDGNTVLVLDTYHPTPRWKIPGGESEHAETPLLTACRELRQETGLRVEDLSHLYENNKGDHVQYVVTARVPPIHYKSEWHEKGRMFAHRFPLLAISGINDLLESHRNILLRPELLAWLKTFL